MEQVDQLLLLQAAHLEDIITITNIIILQVVQDRRNKVVSRSLYSAKRNRNKIKQIKTKQNTSKRNEIDRNDTKQVEKKRKKSKRNETTRNRTKQK